MMDASKFVTGIQHIGLPTGDFEKTIRFYKSLGFSVALRTEDPANGKKVAFLQLKNLTIETYESDAPAGRPGAIDHVALDVSDIDETFRIIQAGGYELLDQAVQFLPFWERGVRFFTILGPNGEKIEFSQMR